MSWQAQYSPLLLQILTQRGYKSKKAVEAFLAPDYESLHDPFLLPDMEAAVARIEQAIQKNEQIIIYGDYDIDGLSATALLVDALTRMGGRVGTHIPDRFDEGYGLATEALKQQKETGADLIITVDCGSTAIEPLTWAAEHALDVIVTDHHTTQEQLPPAVAVINPKRSDSKYPFRDLAGVGVAFKLVQALRRSGIGADRFSEAHEKWLLDLVALGTVCDVVELVDENRTLVYWGIEVMRQTPRWGLRSLAKLGGSRLNALDTHHLGFVLGPRLNASGRLEHANQSLDILLAKDRTSALSLGRQLEDLNSRRRQEQISILHQATKQAEKQQTDPVLVVAHKDWSHGLVGIVAARLVETYAKPAIVIQIIGEEAKGSARSLGAFDLAAAFNATSSFLLKHGGHHFAAGLTLKTAQLDAFRSAINQHYRQLGLGSLEKALEPIGECELEDLSELNWELYKQLERLRPFGRGNPRPSFKLTGQLLQESRPVGSEGKHLKLVLADSAGRTLSGIGFNLADQTNARSGQMVDAWGELDKNDFNGRSSLQLKVKKLTPRL